MEPTPKRCFPINLSGFFGRRSTNQERLSNNKENEDKLFVENGGKLLEELIHSCNGKCNPIRSFSAQEIQKATNDFKLHYYSNFDFDWYVGILNDGRQVLVKRYKNIPYVTTTDEQPNTGPYRDIAISSLMSNHSNALKLLGSCLELPIPMLVYEYVEIGPLNSRGGVGSDVTSSSLSWEMRLKVAKDIANALAYLHMAFSRPVIHMNMFPENVFLDKGSVAKLSNFCCALSIPEGKTVVQTATTRDWHPVYLDPCSIIEGNVKEENDAYSLGLFLLVLLTGRNANFKRVGKTVIWYVKDLVEEGRLINEIVDPKILEDDGSINEGKQQQMQDFLKLALRCIEFKRENRPPMIQVSKELKRIDKSTNRTLEP